MKKVLAINECCSDNIGDHAINYGLQKLILRNSYEARSVGFDAGVKHEKPQKITTDDVHLSFRARFKKKYLSGRQSLKYSLWLMKNLLRVRSTVKSEHHVAIIGGGQLIQSGGTFPIAMFVWTFYCKRKKLPIYIAGVGCAEKFSKLDVWLYKLSFKRAAKIFVRDVSSRDKLKNIFSTESELIPDLAYALYDEGAFLSNKKERTLIGCTSYYVYEKNIKELSRKDGLTNSEYINKWQSIVLTELNNGKEIILASTTVQDAVLNKLVYEKLIELGYSSKIELIETIPSTYEYLALLKNVSKVISGRMHSLILGHISGCEIETIDINKKIDQFMLEYSGQLPSELNADLNEKFKNII
ncbi:Exopolysaccharide biosynthesis protein [Klebsiella oxytoca]|uniref:polysaccharide pyruvyl transferase family protein n=1 Tax=Klebsiella oxytoca TaxID=571 RepID=UPI0007CC34EC|nr:polysaccharide pyruvyl transferase family protein [Klebsiella oxytoca]MBG2596483.1 polysaccharide pyruvyl transferase family protein [Klebsiella oxytoca]SAQ07477.1 Exopolysaccharide biosynthesis protein [Klebsiella oxytoca]SAQ27778.1 Exopolysaccharide biosynthesis protein [Klebsiella oxytoca]SBL32701.1 Exopolysaccharide biosynthesis protein [Klebsiella oxytoca]HCF8091921.1 polysaccharide pyruvyl transferase family protein [Klebsiella oxytoca]